MISNQKIETFITRFLPFYIFIIWIVTISISYINLLKHHRWSYDDWLINYQSGFVRRGFIGECVYQISSLFNFNINIGVIIFLLYSLIYGSIFYLTFKLLRMQSKLTPYIFLIFSPFIFNFQIFEPTGGCRKEIIFFAFLALVVYWAKIEKNFNFKFFIVLCLYPFAILSHEVLFFYMPYLFIPYFFVNREKNKHIKRLSLFSIPSIFAFLFVILFSKIDASVVNNIYLSLKRAGYTIIGGGKTIDFLQMDIPLNCGAIDFLQTDILFNFQLAQRVFFKHHYSLYLVIVLFATWAYLPIKNKIIFIFSNKLFLSLIASTMLMSLSLFFVTIDWGRWIYIHLFSIFLISLLFDTSPNVENSSKITSFINRILSKPVVLIFITLIYAFGWHIPHCCWPYCFISSTTWELPLRYIKPIILVLLYFRILDKDWLWLFFM